jgi:mono/diheme cytochrome c family protein
MLSDRISALIAPIVFGLSVCLVGSVSAVQAQENHIGEQLFMESCAACHGANGRGHGEFSEYLTVPPTNLTVLKKENDGLFPYLRVVQIIDGRKGVRGHGSSKMPIWGKVFSREAGETSGPFDAELLIRARIVALVDYIDTLQAE